jgi:hypothetical protein
VGRTPRAACAGRASAAAAARWPPRSPAAQAAARGAAPAARLQVGAVQKGGRSSGLSRLSRLAAGACPCTHVQSPHPRRQQPGRATLECAPSKPPDCTVLSGQCVPTSAPALRQRSAASRRRLWASMAASCASAAANSCMLRDCQLRRQRIPLARRRLQLAPEAGHLGREQRRGQQTLLSTGTVLGHPATTTMHATMPPCHHATMPPCHHATMPTSSSQTMPPCQLVRRQPCRVQLTGLVRRPIAPSQPAAALRRARAPRPAPGWF